MGIVCRWVAIGAVTVISLGTIVVTAIGSELGGSNPIVVVVIDSELCGSNPIVVVATGGELRCPSAMSLLRRLVNSVVPVQHALSDLLVLSLWV